MKTFSRAPDLVVLSQVYLVTGIAALITYSLWGDSSSTTWRFIESAAWFSFIAFASNLMILYLLKGNEALNKNPDQELAELKKAMFVADALFDITEQLKSTRANRLTFQNESVEAHDKELITNLAQRKSASKAEATRLVHEDTTDKVRYGKALLRIRPFSEEAECIRQAASDGRTTLSVE